MTAGLKSTNARIHAAGASPEKTFAAAVVASAVEAARAGDCTAYVWLESPCSLRWLMAVTPEGDDCERVQQALLATIPALECAADSRAGAIFQPSETASYSQRLLPGLEVNDGNRNRLQAMRPRAPTVALRDSERAMETTAVPAV